MTLQAHGEQRQKNIGFRESENARDPEHSLMWQPNPQYEGSCRGEHVSFLLIDRSATLSLNQELIGATFLC